MRTSKVSRDTARIVNALSSSRPTRRSLCQFGQVANGSETTTIATEDGSVVPAAANSSDLSSPPTSPSSGSDFEEETPVHTAASRKRKRNHVSVTPVKSEKAIKSEYISPNGVSATRQSPRRASRTSNLPKKVRRQPAKRIKGENGDTHVEAPANWEELYNLTAEMRKKVVAPVDTMGCESLAEENRSPLDRRLQTLIALMLSSQTKDTVTAVAMKNLQDNLEGGFNLEALLSVEPDRLNELITKVGFHNNKTKYIKATAEILRDKFAGDIPDTIEGMISLPGVGPKMAYLCMSAAWGRDEGIGVDVHVHRITNLWGWHKTNNPEGTRAELEAWLPREKWHDINHLLVGFGQTICLPVGRKCGECTLAERGLCPSAVVPKEVKKRVRKVVMKEEDGAHVKIETEVKDEIRIKEEKADEDAPSLEPPLPGVGSVPDMEDLGKENRRSLERMKSEDEQEVMDALH